jgi:hypothetical protein
MPQTFNQSLKMLSSNEFSELHILVCNMRKEIQEYSHVSDFLPDNFKTELFKLDLAIRKEYENRDSQC